MANSKTTSIDDYISIFPQKTQEALEQVRKAVHEAAPGAVETIKYDMPTLMLNGANLVHFAAFKNHIGFYAAPTGHPDFEKDFSMYKTGKGSVQFPLGEPMPLTLIKKIVRFRVTGLQP